MRFQVCDFSGICYIAKLGRTLRDTLVLEVTLHLRLQMKAEEAAHLQMGTSFDGAWAWAAAAEQGGRRVGGHVELDSTRRGQLEEAGTSGRTRVVKI